MATTTDLLNLPVWAPGYYPENGTPAERIGASYERAKTVVQHVNMTIDDIVKLTPKFWGFHTDFITTADTAVTTILTIHWNLCMGTIASYAPNQPELLKVLAELQQFESVGEFMLTEVGHGLDARNIETTATRVEDGSFILHTPNPAAAKIMPPTTPHAKMPRLAVVFAQLIVKGERRGVRPFIVRINDAQYMAPGVTSRLLPSRPGAKTVDHAITTFDYVRLEASALLGDIEAPENPRKDFFRHIHRVAIGTLSLSMTNMVILRVSAYVLGRYSQRRRVAGQKPDERVPIITFATQHTPIIMAFTLASVLEAYASEACKTFCLTKEPQVRSALACIFKQTATYSSQALSNEMIDRCGWQGLYGHNQLIELASAIRGNSIAEGDSLVLCIKLVSELLLNRYSIPKARDPKTLLAKHETAVWKEAARLSKSIMITAGSNRNEEFNTMLLPRCRKLVQAIGHRMAYEAAAASNKVSPEMLQLYEAGCILEDPSWYVEHKGFSSSDLSKRHAKAIRALLPSLENMLQESGAAPWATAPILKEESWMNFIEHLPAFTGSKSDCSSSSSITHVGMDTSGSIDGNGATIGNSSISESESVTAKQGTPNIIEPKSNESTPKIEAKPEVKSADAPLQKRSLIKWIRARKGAKGCVRF